MILNAFTEMDSSKNNQKPDTRSRIRDWIMELIDEMLDIVTARIATRQRPLEAIQSLLWHPIPFNFTRLYYFVYHLVLMTLENSRGHRTREAQVESANNSSRLGGILFDKIFPELLPRVNSLPPTGSEPAESRPRPIIIVRYVFRSRLELVAVLNSLYTDFYGLIFEDEMEPQEALRVITNIHVVYHNYRIFFYFLQLLVAIRRNVPLDMDLLTLLFQKIFPDFC